MAKRSHICDVTLNATRASVFEVEAEGAVRHEVELYGTISDHSARFDFLDVCVTTEGVIAHLRTGTSPDLIVAAHCQLPGDNPKITRPQHEPEADNDITR